MVKLAPQERVQKWIVEQVVNVSLEMQSQLRSIQEVHGTMEVPQGQHINRIVSVWQHQVRSIRTVYNWTAQKTVEVVSATEFNVPERWSRSTAVH